MNARVFFLFCSWFATDISLFLFLSWCYYILSFIYFINKCVLGNQPLSLLLKLVSSIKQSCAPIKAGTCEKYLLRCSLSLPSVSTGFFSFMKDEELMAPPASPESFHADKYSLCLYRLLKWPCRLRHESSSSPRTLRSWVRIPLEARMFLSVYSAFVLFCVQVAALRRADPHRKGFVPTVYRINKLKKWPGPNEGL
jgi:hypothetical protein